MNLLTLADYDLGLDDDVGDGAHQPDHAWRDGQDIQYFPARD